MPILFWVIASNILVSLVSLIGVFFLSFSDKAIRIIVSFLVDLSIGVLLAVAFLNLVPEAISKSPGESVFFYVLTGFFLFFLIERILRWRHCHESDCPIHTFAYINLLGDAVHNFTDGLLIGASFVADFNLGIATVVAVVFHEIPHEIGELGVLIYAGFKKSKALTFNFLTALTAILGGVVGFFLSSLINNFLVFLISFAAGGFIYIAASDLIPEVRKERAVGKSLLSFAVAVLGIFLVYFMKTVMPE